MNKFAFLFFLCASCAALYGEPDLGESTLPSCDLQMLFRQDFLEVPDHDLFDQVVRDTIISADSGLTQGELKEKFKLWASNPDNASHFLSIYASQFNEQELQEACELMQDERYLKLRKKFSMVDYLCVEKLREILEEMTAIPEQAKLEKPKQAILHVHKDNWKEILNSSRLVIVDVYTDWCGPCKHLALVMKELNQQYGDVIQFAKLNAEKEKGLAKSLRISAYPTILFFKSGEEVGRHKGFLDKDAFITKMEQLFPN